MKRRGYRDEDSRRETAGNAAFLGLSDPAENTRTRIKKIDAEAVKRDPSSRYRQPILFVMQERLAIPAVNIRQIVAHHAKDT